MWGEGKESHFNEMKLICKEEILVISYKIEDTNMDKHRICCQEAHSLLGKTDIKKSL